MISVEPTGCEIASMARPSLLCGLYKVDVAHWCDIEGSRAVKGSSKNERVATASH